MTRSKWLRRLRKALTVCAVLAVVLLAAGAGGYASLFSGRVETPDSLRRSEARLSGLTEKPVGFWNRDGQELAGRLYFAEGKDADGLIVLAHGMGNGRRAYADVISFFAGSGYFVFAYDATGYDDSGGSSTRGVPQVRLDLDAALDAAEALPEAAGLPVFLVGHSLGAYAVCSVLPEHPEVRAAAALAGFNSTADLIRARFGFAGLLLTPGALLLERLRFGSDAAQTSVDGLASSQAKLLIVHSADDPEVPIACGLELYETCLGADPRFAFLRLEAGGHGDIFTPEVRTACLTLFDSCKP